MWVIGVVDYVGAVHLQLLKHNDSRSHESFWPNVRHKRWRFNVGQWDLDKSPFSEGDFTVEDRDAIERAIRKLINPPRWVRWGDVWNAAGRCRGAAYDKLQEKFDKENPPE